MALFSLPWILTFFGIVFCFTPFLLCCKKTHRNRHPFGITLLIAGRFYGAFYYTFSVYSL
jgi:hypothetical protein